MRMAGVSNGLVGVLNTLGFLLSTAGLWLGIWLKRQVSTECMTLMTNVLIIASVVLMVVALMGLIGACYNVPWLLWIYLFLMFFLILGLLGWLCFTFVITNNGAGKVLSNRGYKEYRLGDYSHWLQKRVENSENWIKIKDCLIGSKICVAYNITYSHVPAQDFYAQRLSPVESGCCKPSNDCDFEYRSPTNWTKREASPASANPDCTAWSNDPRALCYDCQSCKAGLIDNIKGQWKKAATGNLITLIFLIVVYSLGCCAFKNARRANSGYYRWKAYP